MTLHGRHWYPSFSAREIGSQGVRSLTQVTQLIRARIGRWTHTSDIKSVSLFSVAGWRLDAGLGKTLRFCRKKIWWPCSHDGKWYLGWVEVSLLLIDGKCSLTILHCTPGPLLGVQRSEFLASYFPHWVTFCATFIPMCHSRMEKGIIKAISIYSHIFSSSKKMKSWHMVRLPALLIINLI